MDLPMHPPVVDDDPQDAATAAQDRRRLRLGCATGAVPAIAVVVCAGLTLARCLAPLVTSPARPVGTPVPITGSVVLGQHGLEVLYSPGAPCRGAKLTDTESSTAVSLTLTETEAGLGDCSRYPIPPAYGSLVDAGLAAPLGTRRLVDATTGAVVPYLAEDDVLRPRLPMTGWTSGEDGEPFANIGTAMPYFGGPGSAVLVERFTATKPEPLTIGYDQIFVVQVAGGGWHPPPGTAQRPVTVRGRAGVVAAGIVVWSEAGRTVAVLGSLATPVSARPPVPPVGQYMLGGVIPAGAPMPTDRLIAFAATLIGGGS